MQSDQILNQEEFDQMMPALTDAFNSIYAGKSVQISYNQVYQAVFKLCKKGKQKPIIQELTTISREHFKSVFGRLVIDEKMMSSFEKMLNNMNEHVDRILEILLYIESNYFHQSNNEQKSLRNLLNGILYQELSENTQILKQVSKQIAEGRKNGEVEMINKILSLIMEIDQKNEFFQHSFIPVYAPIMAHYYHEHVISQFKVLSQKDHFVDCRHILQNQREWLTTHFLNKKTKPQINKIMSEFYDAIVTTNIDQLYKKDPEGLLKQNTLEFLELLKQKGDDSDIQKFNEWFMNQTKTRLEKLEKNINCEFLEKFIVIYHEVTDSLSGLKKFHLRYKVVFFFEDWINEEKKHFPKRLNLYLKQNLLKQSDSENFMKNFRELFKFLKEKDLFEKLYRAEMTSRMIYYGENYELEDQIIKQMEQQCGLQWVEKINKVRKWPNAFDSSESSKKNIVLNLPNIMLIEDAVWSMDNGKIIPKLPKRLENMEGFMESISKAQSSLKININVHPVYGTAHLQIKFRSKKQNFKVDTLGMAFLLYLEQFGNQTSISTIMNESKYTLKQICQAITDLRNAKVIEIQGEINDKDSVISLCKEYSHSNEEVVDLTKKYLEFQEDLVYANHEQLQPDRKTMVSALVIKAMKKGKLLSTESLFQNVKPMIESRGFIFNEQFVRNIINDLVDRDFIRQTPEGYEYLPV